MSNNKLTEKAHTYLTEGRVTVLAHNERNAVMNVRGSFPEPYVVKYAGNVWDCDCPAHTECAHIIAANLISPLRDKTHLSLESSHKSEFDDLFEQIIKS